MGAQVVTSQQPSAALDQSWTWKDTAEMSMAYALVGSLAAMVIWPTPAVIFGATLFTCAVLIVAFVVSAALEPGAHL